MSDGWSILLWILSLSLIASGFRTITHFGALYLIAGILCLPILPFGNRPGTPMNGAIKVFRILAVIICIILAGFLKTGVI